ncbi:MAG: putative Ig domain-containing protein, partial [Methylovulum sp.]|nr:putative Ig domain-containing protein [Methylovulum sp.]
YVLTEQEVGKTITVEVSYTDGHSTAEGPLSSTATATVANVNDAPVGIPVITGSVTQGATLTADTSGISDVDGLGVFSYVWKANGTVIGGASANTYVLTEQEVGKTITVEVSYTDGHSTAEGPLSSAATATVTNANEAPVGIPVITGSVTQGATLTADTSGITDADGLGVFSYVWKAGGTVIGSASGSTYTLTEAEVGKTITVEVSYTDGHGTAEHTTSIATPVVANVNDAPVGLPTITGTAQQGQTLTAATAGISDADGLGIFSYIWKADSTTIGSATGNTYTLTAAEVGKTITVVVSYTDGHGTAESITSNATAAVASLGESNNAPTNLNLSATNLDENVAANTAIGSFTSTDPDTGNTFTYSLVGGVGSTDNNAFTISGNQLLINGSPDFESRSSYSIRVRSTDQSGLFVDKVLNINVNDQNDAPLAARALSDQSASENSAFSYTIPANSFSDVDAGDTLSYSATLLDGSALPSWLAFNGSTRTFTGTPSAADAGAIVIKITATDEANASVSSTFELDVDDTHSNTAPVLNLGGGSNAAAYGLALQADGKLLVVGYSQTVGNKDIVLLRYDSNGHLDSGFADGGKASTALGAFDDIGRAVAIQADGKILVAGTSDNGSNSDFALLRYNIDGSLDSSFSGDGKLTTALGSGEDYAYAVSVQADGKILVAGYSSNGGNEDFALVRYNSNGSLDSSFSGDGKVSTDFGTSSDYAYDMILQADGKILVVGTSHGSGGTRFALARYNTDGSLDTGFSGDGKTTTELGLFGDEGYAVSVQSDGKILVAGETWNGSGNDFSLVRYHSDGSLDTSFDGDGKLVTALNLSYDYARSMTLQSDGKILIAGFSQVVGHAEFALLRYNSDGSLDSSFGDGGQVTAEISAVNAYGYALTAQSDGKILLAGYSNDGSGQAIVVARYNADGSLDNIFENSGNPSPSGPATVINANAHLYDAELAALGHYNGTTLTLVRHGGADSSDIFSGSGQLSLDGGLAVLAGINIGTVSNHDGSLTISFNSNATQERVDDALSALAYRNTSGGPSAAVVIEWLVSDGNNGAQGQGGAMVVHASSTVYTGGVNTVLTLNNPAAIAYTDTMFDDNYATVNSQFTSNGASGASLSYGIIGGFDNGDGSISKQDSYGLLTVDQSTGSYRFVPNDAAIEPLHSAASALFTITVSNGTETDSKPLSITISQSGSTESNGKDSLVGSAGNDVINGLGGNDRINGAAGKDTVVGGNGNDLINGGNGVDRLTGGNGKDGFVFNTALTGGMDTVTDFSPVADTIRLDNSIFSQLTDTGRLKAENFVIASAAQDSNDYLVYQSGTGTLFYDADANGVGAAVAIAKLGVNLNLGHADFVVI